MSETKNCGDNCGVDVDKEPSVLCDECSGNDRLTFDGYSTNACKSINRNLSDKDALLEGALGLAGEVGEVDDLIKKWAFQGHDLDKTQVLSELGDVLWYVNRVAALLGSSLEHVAYRNNIKTLSRYPDGFSSEASKRRGAP